MVPPVRHAGDVVVPKWISQDHSTVQEGGGAETTAFGGRGGKGVNIKGVQRLWAHPWYGSAFQVLGGSIIGGRLLLTGSDTESYKGASGLEDNYKDLEQGGS